jgi:hypothetical protein
MSDGERYCSHLRAVRAAVDRFGLRPGALSATPARRRRRLVIAWRRVRSRKACP